MLAKHFLVDIHQKQASYSTHALLSLSSVSIRINNIVEECKGIKEVGELKYKEETEWERQKLK